MDAAAAKLVEQRHEQAEAMRKQEAELEARVAQERAAEEARRREIILQLRWDLCVKVEYMKQALNRARLMSSAQNCTALELCCLRHHAPAKSHTHCMFIWISKDFNRQACVSSWMSRLWPVSSLSQLLYWLPALLQLIFTSLC